MAFKRTPEGITIDGASLLLPPQLGGKPVAKAEAQVTAARYRRLAKSRARDSDIGSMLTAVAMGLSVLLGLLAASSAFGSVAALGTFGVLAVVLLGAFFAFSRRANKKREEADVLEEIATLWDNWWLSINDADAPDKPE